MKAVLIALALLAFPARAAIGPTIVVKSHGPAAVAPKAAQANPILFVTAFPVGGFASNTSTFATQKTDMQSSGRGGDLYIRYPDGTLRNLTKEAGYGSTDPTGFQGADAIAVRDPAVYWDGTKAIFSMVIGAPAVQYQQATWYWQLYEVTGLAEGGHAVITKVANQPANFNNIYPTYGTNGAIFFVSDMPRGGEAMRYAYPQADEYESTPTPTGVWKLQNGVVTQMTDSPSGDFHAQVDWYGRVVFTEWDHLQRDQQCDTAAAASAHGCFDYASEADGAPTTTNLVEVFPELRIGADQSHINNHTFNLFFPWAVNQDGTTMETIDHIGRHELQGYFNRSFTDDPAIIDYTAPNTPTRLNECHQTTVVPSELGNYLCIDAPEFGTQAAGAIVQLSLPLGAHADQQPPPLFLTAKVNNEPYDGTPPAGFTGHYRDPVRLNDGTLIASWDPTPGVYLMGDRANPTPNYQFRLVTLTGSPGSMAKATFLTPGIAKLIWYYDPDVKVTYSGNLWEVNAVEVAPRPEPPMTTTALEPPELAAFSDAGVDPGTLIAWMQQRNLSLLVSRDVTTRDDADKQQPYNLALPTGHQTIGNNGKLYTIDKMQIFEGDAVRGYNGRAGRRKLARAMTDPAAVAANPIPPSGAPPGSVTIASDGSIAAFVPARRALTWATLDPSNNPVVRERYWLTTQPGEVRACSSCHGVNTNDQAGNPPAQNTPAALVALAQYWKAQNGGGPPTNQPPVAAFTFTTAGLTASFTDTSTDPDGTILSRQWAFGDGATSTGQNPVHTYTAAGTYSVTLTVADNAGATGSVGHPVTVSVAACTNPHPDQTPVCPDGQHQMGGTWTQNSPPDCSWTYVGGTCPPPKPPIIATIRFGGRPCAGQFDAGTLNLSVVANPAWKPGPSPVYVPKYILTAMDGTSTCTVKGNGPAQVTYSNK